MSAAALPSVAGSRQIAVVLIPGWSKKDFEIAETVAGKLSGRSIPVEVYDIDEFPTQEEILKIIPAASTIVQTPVLAYFVNGEMQSFAQGEDVTEWIPDIAS